MATYWYGNVLVRALTELGAGAGAAKTPKIMLLRDTYTFNANHKWVSEVSTHQATGTSYTAGGLTLTGVAYTYDPVEGLLKVDADDLFPSGLSVLCRYAVFYYDTGTATTSPLAACADLTDDGEDTITGLSVHSAGILTVQVELPE